MSTAGARIFHLLLGDVWNAHLVRGELGSAHHADLVDKQFDPGSSIDEGVKIHHVVGLVTMLLEEVVGEQVTLTPSIWMFYMSMVWSPMYAEVFSVSCTLYHSVSSSVLSRVECFSFSFLN